MSSSLWSIASDRSSSSLSWEENQLDRIDRVVFGDGSAQDVSEHLRHECLLWRKKFTAKPTKDSDKKTAKLKALSAPEINAKPGSQQRSLSEQTIAFPKPLEPIPKSKAKKERANGLNRQLTNSQKPLILPPIVNPNQSKGQMSKISVVSSVQRSAKKSTSFPKPAPVLSLDQILKRSHNCVKEEKSTKLAILPHILDHNQRQTHHKPILPTIKSFH